MRTVRVVLGRTMWRLLVSFPAAVSVGAFLAVVSAYFVHALMKGDGGSTPVAALWAVSVAPFLPVLAALLTSRLVADECMSGRIDLLLSAPVLEREIVFGKFLGAWMVIFGVILLCLMVPIAILPCFSSSLAPRLHLLEFVPAVGALVLQSLLWCACGLLASVCFRPSAVAALVSLVLMVGLPYAAFHAALAWFPVLRMRFAEIPYETHVVDLSTGLVHSSTVAFYLVLTLFALFASGKALALLRCVGRGARGVRCTTVCAVMLALVFSCFVIAFTVRTDFAFELPWRSELGRESARTRQILAETSGAPVTVTCFLARKAPEFRAVSRLLRGLETVARGVAGVQLDVHYVDPRWELGAANRLVRNGVPEGTLIFKRGRRPVRVPVSALFSASTNGVAVADDAGVFIGESVCASALQRLTLPMQRETVYWTTGHGEGSYASYDPLYGMSDIARELLQDGYRLKSIDLARATSIPDDCSVVVIAGAREPFSRPELKLLDGYLRTGGRLLVLSGTAPNAGVGPLLVDWGVRQRHLIAVSSRTLTGSDVLVNTFADHAVTRPLAGCTVLFEGAAVLEACGMAVATNLTDVAMAATADRVEFTALASSDKDSWGESEPSVRPWTFDALTEPCGPLVLAAALERGGGVSRDIAFRPTRIVVIGDASFVVNGALVRRGNANRDFFLNATAWLAGLDALTAARTPGNVVVTDMARGDWLRVGMFSSLVPAGCVWLFGLALLLRGRRVS